MTPRVKVMELPTGERLVTNEDDASGAEALRLGLLPALNAALSKYPGQCCAAALARDGNRLVSVLVWKGFPTASRNGWVTVSATPACDRTAGWLLKLARIMTGSSKVHFIEGGAPWN